MKNKFKIIKKYIDEYDLFSLLDSGAPDDEFDSESYEIAKLISSDSSEDAIAKSIATVMDSAFGITTNFKKYKEIAIKIKSKL
jgi:hypothetical protein